MAPLLRSLLGLAVSAMVIAHTPEQLADKSTHVLRATVVRKSSAKEPGPAGIYTRITLRVEEGLKGRAPHEVVIRQAGGTVGTEKVELVGDAQLEVGEQVLAFVRCDPGADACSLVGLAQGKYHLQDDGQGGLSASRDFSRTAFVNGAALSGGPESYAALAARIRAHVAQQEKAADPGAAR